MTPDADQEEGGADLEADPTRVPDAGFMAPPMFTRCRIQSFLLLVSQTVRL